MLSLILKFKKLIRETFNKGRKVSWNSKVINSTLESFVLIGPQAFVGNSHLRRYVQIAKFSNVSGSDLGDYTSVGRFSNIINSSVGKYCSISWNVSIGATQHHIKHISTHAFSYISNFGFVKKDQRIIVKTEIGHDVWLGANSVVMPGVKIGCGAIIGAGAVVTKDIEPYNIAAGVPARIIGKRFDDEKIERIQTSRWWDANPSKIQEQIELFQKDLSDNILSDLGKLCEE
jgi:hypothetical protein